MLGDPSTLGNDRFEPDPATCPTLIDEEPRDQLRVLTAA